MIEPLRITAFSAGIVSTVSFILIAVWVGSYNPAIARVVIADAVAAVLLITGLAAEILRHRKHVS